jgi:hypothetical protein
MRTIGSLLRKNSPVLRTGRFHPSSLRRSALALEKWAPAVRRTREIEEEVQKIEELVAGIGVRLIRAEEKMDLHLEEMSRTLRELAEQRDQIRSLERELGIERPDA